jgi:uncharacterized membrane protein
MQPPYGDEPEMPAAHHAALHAGQDGGSTPRAGSPPFGSSSPGPPDGSPRVRFEIIGEAWALFQHEMATWVLAVLLYFFIVGVPAALCLAPLYYKIFTTNSATLNADPLVLIGPLLLVYGVLIFVVVPLSMNLMGGLYRMAIRQLRGESIAVSDLFRITDVLGALVGSMFLVGLAVMAAALLGCVLCGLPGLVVGALLMLTVPLIVDRRIGSAEAMKLSWNALKPHWLMATLFYFVISLIAQAGMFVCYVGIVFTFPIFILAIAILYRDFFDRPASPQFPLGPAPGIAPGIAPGEAPGFDFTPR